MASTTTTAAAVPTNPDTAIDAHSRSRPQNHKTQPRLPLRTPKPPTASPHRRTRAFLRVLRSSLLFVFWRVVRYAKYDRYWVAGRDAQRRRIRHVCLGCRVCACADGDFGHRRCGDDVGGGDGLAVRRVKGRWERGNGYTEVEEKRDERHVYRGAGCCALVSRVVWERVKG